MRRITLACRACGRRFAIPVVADAFGLPRLGEAEWDCAWCGERARYQTKDYRMERPNVAPRGAGGTLVKRG